MIIEEGTNEEIISARNRIPEPTRTDLVIYRSLIPEKNYILSFHEPEPIKPLRVVIFEKILIAKQGSYSFYAWKSKEDGKIYL